LKKRTVLNNHNLKGKGLKGREIRKGRKTEIETEVMRRRRRRNERERKGTKKENSLILYPSGSSF